jgi:hypothetical protein
VNGVALAERCPVAYPNRPVVVWTENPGARLTLILELSGSLACGHRAAIIPPPECLGNLPPRDVLLAIPDMEALHVKLDRPHPSTDAFHDEVGLRDHFAAGDARFAVPRSAPDAGDAVLRKATIGELGANEGPEFLGGPTY